MDNDRPDLWPEAVPMWLKKPEPPPAMPPAPPADDDDREPAP